MNLGLDDVVVRDLRIALAIEHDLDEGVVVDAAPELDELRLHVAADSVVHVSASHREIQSHGASSSRCTQPTALPARGK